MEDRGTDHAGNGGVIISKRPSYTVQATSQLETFMSLYQILIEGRNFLITVEGDCAKHGFLTYRYVEASDPESAGNKAVQMIRGSVRTSRLVNFSACELHAVALGKEGYAHADAGLFRLPEAV